MNDIDTLIPHRDPFQFVDEILSAEEDEIVGVKTYDDPFFMQGHFPERKIVPGVILIESMAQCGGAGINKIGIVGDALWGLASLEEAHFLSIVDFGKTVKMVIKNLKISNRGIKQSGTAFCDGKIVVTATWVCARLK
jgi:3-hydroxyacyl-[acyl-carrier-protein] dehydratase